MPLRGTNQESGRPYNRRLVLEAIRTSGPVARGGIASRVGLTVQTVSTIVRELEEQGYILSAREEPKRRGLPAAILRINPQGGYAVGVHLTPLGIDAVLADLSGEVVDAIHRKASHPSPDRAFALIGKMVGELTARRPGSRILGVGMAMPGPFGVETMSFVGPTTMTGWSGVALKERLSEATGLTAFIENDMAAAALGEQLYGYGRQLSEYYYLYFGYGLGGTMVHDGAVLRGAWGNAGEIGHVPMVPGGEECACGNRGCLERYVSLEAFERSGKSEAAWVSSVAPIFRNAITAVENLFDPEAVVIGGLASASLLDGLAAEAANLPNSVSARRDRSHARVLVAKGGAGSVLRGAAALAISGTLSPRFGQMFESEERDTAGKGKGITAKGIAA